MVTLQAPVVGCPRNDVIRYVVVCQHRYAGCSNAVVGVPAGDQPFPILFSWPPIACSSPQVGRCTTQRPPGGHAFLGFGISDCISQPAWTLIA